MLIQKLCMQRTIHNAGVISAVCGIPFTQIMVMKVYNTSSIYGRSSLLHFNLYGSAIMQREKPTNYSFKQISCLEIKNPSES